VLDALLERFASDGRAYVHVLRGEGAPDEDELRARAEAHGIEADVSPGGQPHYPVLLWAE
jgi:hypothetical protein